MNNPCIRTTKACDEYIPGKCVYYSGANLSCTGIIFGDSLDVALRKIDTYVCETLQQEIYSTTLFEFVEFMIGEEDSLMLEGETTLILTTQNIAVDSVWISLNGSELPRKPVDRKVYGVLYEGSQITINFLDPVMNGDLYIIHYAYNMAISVGLEFKKLQFRVGSPGSLINVNGLFLDIIDTGIVADTIDVIVSGQNLSENTSGAHDDEYSYIRTPLSNGVRLTFNNPAQYGQSYIIYYTKIINNS